MLVWHTDRLHRSPRELEDFITLCERRRITTQTVMAGSLDLNTSSGRMVARMLGAAARQEVEHKSDRIKASQLQAARSGKWIGGTPPLGWNVRADGTATLDTRAAKLIRKATADVLAGVSLGSIVSDWNRTDFLTSTGRPWTYSSLRQVLTRARNAGFVEYAGQIEGASIWPAIVTEDAWRALSAMLADPGRRRSQSNRAKWLLAGIALCGKAECGSPLRSATVGSNRAGETSRHVYRCPETGRGHVARSAKDVDATVHGVVCGRLAAPNLQDLLPDASRADIGEMQGESVALRARLRQAAESFADGAISAGQLNTITARVNERLAAVEGEIAGAARGSAIGGLVAAHDPVSTWGKLSIERQRAVISELMSVTVMPGLRGKVFDPDLIRISWNA